MEEKLNTINQYLVAVFNDVLTIEENELKKTTQFHDLSITEMHTIEAIGLHEERTTTEVANQLMVTVGTLTVAINNLVKKDYVKRVRGENDRRVVKLVLTKKGRVIFRMHRKFHEAMIKSVITGMSEEEETILLRGLVQLHSFLKGHSEK